MCQQGHLQNFIKGSDENSLTRVRRIQSLLQSENDDSSSKPDAILCIAGIDGRYNEGTLELIDYLLFGFFSLRKYEIERSGFEEETVDDMVLLIRKHSVEIYCNPINYMYLLPYIAHWRNLHVHCMTDEDYEDSEKAEEFKINSFVAMTDRCRKIGIPYSCTSQRHEFDIMQLEKWPLIQAFALEGVGGGGFFTLKYEVQDISDIIHDVYQSLDPVSLENIITHQLPQFGRQWDTMLSIIDINENEKLSKLKASTLGESLLSYFNFGNLTRPGSAKRSEDAARRPFLLLGSDTSGERLRDAHKSGRSSTDDMSSLGTENSLARHMVCQAVSPKASLCCRRTYFFTTAVLPYPVFDPSGDAPRMTEKSDAKIIISVYTVCIDALLVAIQTYAMTRSVEQAHSVACEALLEAWEAAAIPVSSSHLAHRHNVEFKIEAVDSENKLVPLTDPKSHVMVKSASLTVYDLPSVEHPSQTIGSVSFGEAFLESVLNVEHPGGRVEYDSEVTILTSEVPRFISWAASHEEHRKIKQLNEELTSHQKSDHMGEQLIPGQVCHLVREGDRDLTIPDGNLYIYERGIVYLHPHHGAIVLPKTEISALHYYDGDSPSVVAMLIVSYQEHLRDYIPLPLRCRSNRFILAFLPKSKAKRLLITEVLPVWKDENETPPLRRIEEIPDELDEIHKVLQSEYSAISSTKTVLTPMKKAALSIEGLKGFMPHFESSTAIDDVCVARKHVSLVAGREYDPGSFNNEDRLIVSIIGGVPGSGKTVLGQHLSKFAKDEQNWAVIKQAVNSTEGFSAQNLQLTLAHTWQAIQKRRGRKLVRVLVITPGYTDTVDVVQAISSIPDPDVARHISIGAVTVCIDPDNAYMCDRYSLPKLLDQCAQGWVNNIVFTSPHKQSAVLDQLQTTIRALNSDVALLIAPRAEVTRSNDIDLLLSTTAFDDATHIRSRYLSCPGWWQGNYNSGPNYPEIGETVLRFSRPLDKTRLTTKLKGLRTTHSKYPFIGNIYNIRGKIVFEDSPQVYEMRYTVLSQHLSLVPSELKPTEVAAQSQNGNTPSGSGPYCVVFSGVQLEVSQLKQWLQSCAKQKPTKKALRTKSSLTRAELNKIHKERHLESLPEGWFYNGSQFLSLAGDKENHHPNMDLFIEEYLQKVNAEIEAYNKRVASEESHELF